jgi:hypothetical protein
MRKITVQSQPGQIVHETLSQKYLIQRRASRVAQMVECLRSKSEALSSNLNTAKKKREEEVDIYKDTKRHYGCAHEGNTI